MLNDTAFKILCYLFRFFFYKIILLALYLIEYKVSHDVISPEKLFCYYHKAQYAFNLIVSSGWIFFSFIAWEKKNICPAKNCEV